MLDYDLFVMIASNLELFDILSNPLITKLSYVLGRNIIFANSQYALKFCFNTLRPNKRRKKPNHDLNYAFIHLSYGLQA